ncbi:MAG: phosphoribosyltransferase [Candidatus Kerfeldbacteria bacterium]|nr:phosphoribosyltransferase [Candidatus Kerfeldbacteria bacterium]
MTKSFWTVQEIAEKSARLGKRIQQSAYRPDLVVGIKYGGHLVGTHLAKVLGVPYSPMSVKCRLSTIIPRMPEKFRRFRFLYSALEDLYYLFSQPFIHEPLAQQIGSEQKVLLVDDDVVLSKTIDVAKNHLLQMGARKENIKTAAMIVHPKQKENIDFFVELGEAVFPWSIYSPHYEDFKRSNYAGMM